LFLSSDIALLYSFYNAVMAFYLRGINKGLHG
jgi:hypothetical protein